MEIEKEIKQKASFWSEHQKLVVNILFTSSWLQLQHVKLLRPFELTPQQFNILRILRGQHPEPVTVNTLIERMLDKSSNASRLVDRLAVKGFVTKTTNLSDKRSVLVSITEKGLETLLKADGVIRKMESEMKTLTRQEAEQLNKLLNQLRG